jgi:hydroxymethylpyrimidine/phosphomethylpyrimidine kinase
MTINRNDPTPPLVLVFAASDPTGGAGVQADIMTISGMGCHALTVITALTVQDTVGVEDVLPVDADFVSEQARAVLEDMPVQAFKLGVLGSVENIAVIAEIISDYPHIPVVVDPVIASGRGDELASEAMLATLRELILPQATVITPNTMEAPSPGCPSRRGFRRAQHVRLRSAAACDGVPVRAHNRLPRPYAAGDQHPLQAGGVLRTDAWRRCRAVITVRVARWLRPLPAALAHGLAVSEAAYEAQGFTWQTLASAFRPGMGQHIPDRFFWARPAGPDSDDA